jgi:hypothetical protein
MIEAVGTPPDDGGGYGAPLIEDRPMIPVVARPTILALEKTDPPALIPPGAESVVATIGPAVMVEAVMVDAVKLLNRALPIVNDETAIVLVTMPG